MENTGDWLWQCFIPDNTELQEHKIKTARSIIVGEKCRIDYGLSGDEVIVCEFSKINGAIQCENDLRIDNWTEINGDVTTGGDAYIGEGAKITGHLLAEGSMDIGDNVSIPAGFEAKGWISIRNPMPVLTYIMLYLITFLGLEKEDEINEFFKKLFSEDEEEETAAPLVIPPNSTLNMEIFTVPTVMKIGKSCRLHGNIRAESITVGEGTTIFGSLTADKDVTIENGTVIHGAINSAAGNVTLAPGSHVLGDVRCVSIMLDEEALLDGTIKAPGGVKIIRK